MTRSTILAGLLALALAAPAAATNNTPGQPGPGPSLDDGPTTALGVTADFIGPCGPLARPVVRFQVEAHAAARVRVRFVKLVDWPDGSVRVKLAQRRFRLEAGQVRRSPWFATIRNSIATVDVARNGRWIRIHSEGMGGNDQACNTPWRAA